MIGGNPVIDKDAHPTSRRHPARRNEAGATLVLLTLSLVALLAVAGLAVDGGALYADRRQMQNAADAAALAGANALNRYWSSPTDARSIWDAVRTTATANKAAEVTSCFYVDEDGNRIDPSSECDDYVGPSVPPTAAGVQVSVRDTQATTFMRVVGVSTFQAGARAQARVQALVSGQGPIMVCAVLTGDPRTGNGKGVQVRSGAPLPMLLPDDTLNPLAVSSSANPAAPEYWLKGVEVKDTCSMGNQWKGLVDQGHGSHDDGVTYPLPGVWNGDNGNQAGPTRTKVLGACNQEAVGCRIQVPLCYWKANLGPNQLYCARMGVFEITYGDANTYAGKLVGEGNVIDQGQGGGKPLFGEARVIKLTL